jgi:hypothetical protein
MPTSQVNTAMQLAEIGKKYTDKQYFFEGLGYYQQNLDQWNGIPLSTIVDNPGKTLIKGIQLLLNKLQHLQYGLAPDLQTMAFFDWGKILRRHEE